MLPGYHRIFNGFAFQEVNRGLDMPNPALSIGFAEYLAPLPSNMTLSPLQKPPVTRPIMSIDQASVDGQGDPVSMSMFPNTGYMGEMLGDM